jgi:excisionase family DNA binding protein
MATTTTTTLYTPAEAAEQIPYHPQTLVRFARVGKIGHVRFGNRVCFTQAHIDAFIATHEVPPKTEAKPSRNPKYTR